MILRWNEKDPMRSQYIGRQLLWRNLVLALAVYPAIAKSLQKEEAPKLGATDLNLPSVRCPNR